MKASKKPMVIDYFPIDSKEHWVDDIDKLREWVEIELNESFDKHFTFEGYGLKVITLEGTSYNVSPLDVIIYGIAGEFYPCKKDIFEQTYNKIQ